MIMEYLNLIKKYKTPFYHFDIPELKSRVEMMKSHQGSIGLCYAMKAGPMLAGYISPYVERLEVCSPGEYEICAREGIVPEKIFVSGVNKTRESMMRILSLGGEKGYFSIESIEQYNILEDVASRSELSGKLKCYIRLSSGNQFGVDRDTLDIIIKKLLGSENLELLGIHFFSGTQKKMKKVEEELTELAQLGKNLEESLGRKLSLEYGPGLGIDYFINGDGSAEINEPSYQFAEPAIEELMDIVGRTGLEDCYSDITFEYGRYIAAPCGKYFTGVADVKRTGETDYAILEGGLHQITYFGSMAGMKVPYINYISDTSKNESRDYVLAGSLCSVNDILVRKVNLPRLEIGDTLCFNLAGAYCATEGISLFLSRDLPAIVVTEESGNEMLLRKHIETNYLNGGYNG